MTKLYMRPSNASYSVQRGSEVLSVKLDGGASKYRRDILNASFTVTVSWDTTEDGWDYLNAFYRTATARGSLPFTIDLLLEDSTLTTYTAYFVPDTFKLTGQQGEAYYIEATLEVTPIINPSETTDDNATISAWEAAHPNGI